MVKIDLHLHSPNSRQNGDSIKWTSLYHSIEKLLNNDVKIAAFSDHNIFNPSFYKEARELAKTANILLLPAIEVNVVRKDGNIANILYIFNDDLTDDQLEKISSIAKKELPKKGIPLNNVNQIFNEFDLIIIPHVGKSDHLKYEDLLEIKYDAIEISSRENPNYVVVSKKDINTSIVAFSDTHKWDEYPQVRKLITEIDDSSDISFRHLKSTLNKNKDFTKERI